MAIEISNALGIGVLAYVAVGAAFAVWFSAVGANRLDPAAAKSSWGFRVIILPGAAALWPLLLLRLKQGGHR